MTLKNLIKTHLGKELFKTEDGFVISGFSWITEDKGYPSYDYTAPGYDPV